MPVLLKVFKELKVARDQLKVLRVFKDVKDRKEIKVNPVLLKVYRVIKVLKDQIKVPRVFKVKEVQLGTLVNQV